MKLFLNYLNQFLPFHHQLTGKYKFWGKISSSHKQTPPLVKCSQTELIRIRNTITAEGALSIRLTHLLNEEMQNCSECLGLVYRESNFRWVEP